MDAPTTESATNTDCAAVEVPEATDGLVEELLIEEISIDGMCGVY